MSVFDPAIAELAGGFDSRPESFVAYWARTGQTGKPATASHISVQTRAGLDAALARERLFPFRLGRSQTKGTAFALARSESVDDFFLLDDEVFVGPHERLETDLAPGQLFQYRLFARQVEVNAVNLALASGGVARALCLDSTALRISPATVSSTFSFPVRPTGRSVVHQHDRGQVEIDAVFVAQRAGAPVVVVIEAKHGGKGAARSLAKTKLAYPLAAVLGAGRVPAKVPVIGVYLRTWTEGSQFGMSVAECAWAGMDALRSGSPAPGEVPPVASLAVRRAVSYRLNLPTRWPGSPAG